MIPIRVKVNAYEKALIFKDNELIRVLDKGNYWIHPMRKVVKYDITELFYHDIDISLLLQCEDLKARVETVEIADDEIGIQYKKGNFNRVLTPGTYVYWKSGISMKHEIVKLNEAEISSRAGHKLKSIPAVLKYMTYHTVENYEIAIEYVDGQINRKLKPGTYYYWKSAKNIVLKKIDMRAQQMEISGQELLTLDKAAVRMSLFATYKVVNINQALVETKDYAKQLYIALQLGLREYVGKYTLDQLLQNKTTIGPYIKAYVNEKAASIGLEMIDCGLRDIILPGDIKEIMNQVLVAEKKAQANTIMRREETASTRSLLNTAKLMADNDMLFKLKEMEYMEKIAERVGEITINGGGRIIDQLKELVGSK